MAAPPGRIDLDSLRERVEQAYPDYLSDLERLVNIDSGSHTKAGVDQVSEWLMGRLSDLGASVVRHRNEGLGDTFVAAFEGAPDRATILMIGHADTVFRPGTAAARPFTIAGRRAQGPGVSDMKGGLLAGLYALSALRHRDGGVAAQPPAGGLIFVVNADEELGSPGSSAVIRGLAREAQAALVLEAARPTGEIISARSGMAHLRVTVHGRAAHAGVEPEKGRNAILEAAHKTLALDSLNGRWDGVHINVGEIRGGTRPNIVPDKAVMDIDLRARTRAAQAAAGWAVRTIARSVAVPGTAASVQLIARHRPMEKTPASARLVEMAAALGAELGSEFHDTGSGGASDANTTAAMGVPTLDGLGPIGGGWHTAAEYLDVDSIVPRITLLAALLATISRQPGSRR